MKRTELQHYDFLVKEVKTESELFAPTAVRWTACKSCPEDNVSIKDKQRPRECGRHDENSGI
jgi:hypothetical protein